MATQALQPKRYNYSVPTGRPSIKSPELISEICERVADGETLSSITRCDGMPSFPTIWKWAREDENFSKALAGAKEIGTHKIADDCIDIADRAELEAHDRRIRIDTRMRLIGQWNKAVYGAHSRTEITGKDGGAIQIEAQTEKLQALAQTLREAKRTQTIDVTPTRVTPKAKAVETDTPLPSTLDIIDVSDLI